MDEVQLQQRSGGNNCVEVKSGKLSGNVLVRHSLRPMGWQSFTRAEWRAFVQGVKAGEFDLPDDDE